MIIILAIIGMIAVSIIYETIRNYSYLKRMILKGDVNLSKYKVGDKVFFHYNNTRAEGLVVGVKIAQVSEIIYYQYKIFIHKKDKYIKKFEFDVYEIPVL